MINLFGTLGVEPENRGLLKKIYYAFFASGLMSIMLGALLPYIRDENSLNYAQSGLMFSAHQLGCLCAVLAAGFLPYLLGRKRATILMGAGSPIGMILMVVFKSPWPLVAAFVFTGIGRGIMGNICNVVSSEVSRNKAGALSMLHALYATGALLSPVVIYVFTRSGSAGWKLAALTAAAFTASGLLLLGRSELSDGSGAKKGERASSMPFLKDASFWLSTMILFCYLCAEVSIIGWFVMYFEDIGKLPTGVAKFIPTMVWLMIMLGRILCASISARVDKNKLLLVLSVSFTLCYAGMLFSSSAWMCVMFLLGVGFSMSGIYPTTFSTIKYTDSTVATGFVISIASIGGIMMPGIVGAVADVYGLTGGVATVLAALGGMTVLVIVKLLKFKDR